MITSENPGHKPGIVWFTGLSGSGKSTLSKLLEQRLLQAGMKVFVLDGDVLRRGLNSDLGFSKEDRSENIRRVAEVAALFASAGFVVITALISPYEEDRKLARNIAANHIFTEVHIKCDVATCEARDPKGLYKKARSGEIAGFTGISSPYEEPRNADLVIDTGANSINECLEKLASYAQQRFKG